MQKAKPTQSSVHEILTSLPTTHGEDAVLNVLGGLSHIAKKVQATLALFTRQMWKGHHYKLEVDPQSHFLSLSIKSRQGKTSTLHEVDPSFSGDGERARRVVEAGTRIVLSTCMQSGQTEVVLPCFIDCSDMDAEEYELIEEGTKRIMPWLSSGY